MGMMANEHDRMVLKAVQQVGIEIDQESLIQAIKSDRKRYEEAYKRSYADCEEQVGMSLEFVNRICPNCKNPNYMVLLGEFSKAYKYKCMNCNGYFNDIDFEKEPLKPVWKSECMNSKVDMVEVVRCKDCRHCKQQDGKEPWLSCLHLKMTTTPYWFCTDGKRKEGW